MLLDKSIEYFTAFSEKNIDKLRNMFSNNVSLRDWEIEATGIDHVVEANSKIFNSVETITVDPIKLYQDEKTVIAEIEITVNEVEKILVTDILEYDEDNKIKSQIIRDYLDGMEMVMKKHSKVLGTLLTDYTKKRIQKPDPDSGDLPMWDELVVNNFKIKKIHVSQEFGGDFEDDDDIDGFPFELYTDNGDLADYITRTTQKIKL